MRKYLRNLIRLSICSVILNILAYVHHWRLHLFRKWLLQTLHLWHTCVAWVHICWLVGQLTSLNIVALINKLRLLILILWLWLILCTTGNKQKLSLLVRLERTDVLFLGANGINAFLLVLLDWKHLYEFGLIIWGSRFS